MIAFEIEVNGEKACVAGVSGIFSAALSCVDDGSESVGFIVSGTEDPATGRYLFWPVPRIKVGDSITIRVVETNSVDPGTDPEQFEYPPA